MHAMSKFLHQMLARTTGATRRFASDKSGIAAVEFVFIAPLIIVLWLGTMEISQGIEVNKKVGRSASVIGDILTQTAVINVGDLEDIMKIGASVIQPYKRAYPTVTVSEVMVDAGLSAKIVWSRKGQQITTGFTFSSGYAVNSPVVLPANLKVANTYLVKVETDLDYIPVTNTSYVVRTGASTAKWGFSSAVWHMREAYYLRPRVNDDVACNGC
jgi:Flp pilus assembly protein TadG